MNTPATLVKSLSTRRRSPQASTERLVIGVALTLLSIFLFYLKVLSAVVRYGIKAVTRAGQRSEERRREIASARSPFDEEA